MAEIVRMPKLSDTMTEGMVAKWHKKIGDVVKSGDLIAEIETDKATMEFESFQDGVLLYIGVEQGKAAPVDSILAILGKAGEDVSSLISNDKHSATQPIKKEEQIVVTPEKKETQQPATEIAAPQQTHDAIAVSKDSHRLKVSPLAKKIAEEKGINLSNLKGSGEDGRIVKRDLEQLSTTGYTAAVTGVEGHHDEPVSQMRKTIARRLAESKFTAPHFYLTLEIDMGEIIKVRESINSVTSTKISFNDIVIKAVGVSLRKHPKVNASWLGDVIRYHHHIHIGVAIAVEEGLLVPVVRFADQKTLSQIAGEVRSYAAKAKDKKLQPSDWEGNTFTISNLGMFGIDEFTAIINPPDACILAVGGIKEVAMVKNGNLIAGHVMKVTLSCDHRVVDGATGAAFLQTLKHNLENPVLMLGAHSI